LNELKAWEKLPNESSKAYKAAYVYFTMVDPNSPVRQSRSIEKVAQIMGYKPTSVSQLHKWSSEYNWVARAEAYDAHMASQIITYQEVGLEEYQSAVVGSLVQQLAVMDEILNKALTSLRTQALSNPDSISVKELNTLINAIEKKDNLARRAGKMATSYLRDNEVAQDDTDIVYVIGGADE
jgi:hypothetical protein